MKPRLRIAFLAFLVFHAATLFAATPAAEMSEAANRFLNALDSAQRGKATFDWQSDERTNWHYVPKARVGLPFKEMTEWQRELAQALLHSGLSQRGYIKATSIMSLELVLFDMENKNTRRDPELYYISIFGKPGGTNAWSWRVEGHHLSINFTIAGGKEISVTPSFFGSNPAEVREGPRKGLRVLADEEDLGRELVKSFSDAQRNIVVFATNAPREIITGNSRKAKVLETVGLAHEKMSSKQQALLVKLIQEYLSRYRPELMKADWAKIEKAGLGKVHFGWAGGVERGEKHYYRIQGPTFLMEYDNTQNNGNHIHTVWRDFEDDFGEDLLREHYDQSHHKN